MSVSCSISPTGWRQPIMLLRIETDGDVYDYNILKFILRLHNLNVKSCSVNQEPLLHGAEVE